jgi:hypothetical protein
MIVRISTEGQYELASDDVTELEQLDRAAVDACEVSNEADFHASFTRLLEFVRSRGHLVSSEDLAASDLILPPPDVTFDEARAEFTAEGLLPD